MSTVMAITLLCAQLLWSDMERPLLFHTWQLKKVCRRAMEVDPERVQGQKGQFLTAHCYLVD